MKVKHLKAILAAAAKGDIRYYLNGINVRQYGSDEPVIYGSDGHMCIEVEVKDNSLRAYEDCNVIICRESLTWVLKKFKANTELTLSVTNEGAYLNGEKLDLIDGRFPDIRRVMNHKGCVLNQGDVLLFDPELFSKITACVGKFKTTSRQAAHFTMYDGRTSSVVELDNKLFSVVSLLMPCNL